MEIVAQFTVGLKAFSMRCMFFNTCPMLIPTELLAHSWYPHDVVVFLPLMHLALGMCIYCTFKASNWTRYITSTFYTKDK